MEESSLTRLVVPTVAATVGSRTHIGFKVSHGIILCHRPLPILGGENRKDKEGRRRKGGKEEGREGRRRKGEKEEEGKGRRGRRMEEGSGNRRPL